MLQGSMWLLLPSQLLYDIVRGEKSCNWLGLILVCIHVISVLIAHMERRDSKSKFWRAQVERSTASV